jgi:hypothetical protein
MLKAGARSNDCPCKARRARLAANVAQRNSFERAIVALRSGGERAHGDAGKRERGCEISRHSCPDLRRALVVVRPLLDIVVEVEEARIDKAIANLDSENDGLRKESSLFLLRSHRRALGRDFRQPDEAKRQYSGAKDSP